MVFYAGEVCYFLGERGKGVCLTGMGIGIGEREKGEWWEEKYDFSGFFFFYARIPRRKSVLRVGRDIV